MKTILIAVCCLICSSLQSQTLIDRPMYAGVTPRFDRVHSIVRDYAEERIIQNKFGRSLSEDSHIKMGLAMLKEGPDGVDAMKRIINGIDMSNGDSDERIEIDSESFGYDNAKLDTDTVHIFSTNLSDRWTLNYCTLIIKSPSRRDNVGLYVTLDWQF